MGNVVPKINVAEVINFYLKLILLYYLLLSNTHSTECKNQDGRCLHDRNINTTSLPAVLQKIKPTFPIGLCGTASLGI